MVNQRVSYAFQEIPTATCISMCTNYGEPRGWAIRTRNFVIFAAQLQPTAFVNVVYLGWTFRVSSWPRSPQYHIVSKCGNQLCSVQSLEDLVNKKAWVPSKFTFPAAATTCFIAIARIAMIPITVMNVIDYRFFSLDTLNGYQPPSQDLWTHSEYIFTRTLRLNNRDFWW